MNITAYKPIATDWDRVKREAAADAPIAANSDEPYDPNNAEEVAVYWNAACIKTVLPDAIARGAVST